MAEIGSQVPEEARIELDAVVREGQIAADLQQRSEGHLLHTAVTHRQVAVDFRNLRESVATPPVDQVRDILKYEIAMNPGNILETVVVEELVAAAFVIGRDIAQDDAALTVDFAEEGFGGLDRSAVDGHRTLHDGDLRRKQRHSVVRDVGTRNRQVLDLLTAGTECGSLGIGLDRIAVNAARLSALADERRVGHSQWMVVRQGHVLRFEHRIGDEVFDDIETVAVRLVRLVLAQRGIARNVEFPGHLLDSQHTADIRQQGIVLDINVADDELHAQIADGREGFVARNLESGRNRRGIGQRQRPDSGVANQERADGGNIERGDIGNIRPFDGDAVCSRACGESIDLGLRLQREIPTVRVRRVGRIFTARGQSRTKEQCGGRKQVFME